MIKLDLLEPTGTLSPETVSDALTLLDAEEHLTSRQLAQLTPNELLLVYDWAMREHLAAGANRMRRRDRPHLLTLIARTTSDQRAIGEQTQLIDKQSYVGVEQTQLINDQTRVIAELIAERDEAQARVVDLESQEEVERVH